MPLKTMKTSRSVASSSRTLPIVIALAALTAACQQSQISTNSGPDDGYRTRHPIVFSEVPETMDIPVGLHTQRLSQDMRSRVRNFAHQARTKGNGSVEILVPSGSANEGSANALAQDIRRTVRSGGIPTGRIAIRAYPVDDPKVIAPVRVAYARVKAVAGPCGLWQENVGPKFSNRDDSEFGCATQANFAAMLQNPADLLGPRVSTAPDAMRRSTVFENYRAGEPTAGEYVEGLGTEVSED